MAQSDKLNLIEQHVEKGVLLLCAILLIWTVSRYVVGSPRHVDVYDGQRGEVTVSPQKVDEAIETSAQRIMTRAEEAEPGNGQVGTLPSETHLAQVDHYIKVPFEVSLEKLIGLTPPPPLVQVTGVELREWVELSDLQVQIPPELKPQAWAGHVLYKKPAGDGAHEGVDAVVAHIVAKDPRKQWVEAWDPLLKKAKTKIRVVVAGSEVEAQMRQDGEWIDRQPTLVDLGATRGLPELPPTTGDNAEEIRQVVEQIRVVWQDRILHPNFWEVYGPQKRWGSWTTHLPEEMSEGISEGQAIWFHDTGLRPGRAYRYRYRLKLVNPLLGATDDVNPAKPDQAKQPYVVSSWSSWSAPVFVSSATEFFVVAASSTTRNATVVVYTKALGRVISQKFIVSVGKPIGGVKTLTLQDPVTRQDASVDVDFSTGAVLVALNFSEPTYRGLILTRDKEAVYLDAEGRLRTRLVTVDKAQESKKGEAP